VKLIHIVHERNFFIFPINFTLEICKEKTEVELLEAEENFREYLLVIKGMCNRIDREEKEATDFDDLSMLKI
jgi:hypothetical protein